MPKQLHCTVIGLGQMGRIRSQLIYSHPNCRLVSVCSTKLITAQNIAEGLGPDIRVFVNAEDAITDPVVDAVVIATPTITHDELVTMALRRGKHVFVEMPLLGESGKLRHLYQAANLTSKLLIVGFQKQFEECFQSIQETIHLSKGNLGKVMLIRIKGCGFPLPSQNAILGGKHGNFLTYASMQDIFLIRMLTQESPENVWACASSTLGLSSADDVAAVMLKLPSGCLAIIESARQHCYGLDYRIEVLGTNGMISSKNPGGAVAVLTQRGSRQLDVFSSFQKRFGNAFTKEWDAFCNQTVVTEMEKSQAMCNERAEKLVFEVTRTVEDAEDARKKQNSGLAGVCFPKPPMDIRSLRAYEGDKLPCLIIGVGKMGYMRARAIVKSHHGYLMACYDVDQPACRAFATQFGCQAIRRLDVILSERNLKCVFICTTSNSHETLFAQVVEAGKAVFIEAPHTQSVNATLRMLKLCETKQVPFTCGFWMRSDRSLQQLQEEVQKKDVTMELLRVTVREAMEIKKMLFPANSGGFLWEYLINEIDLIRWLVGVEPLEICAMASAFIPEIIEANDNVNDYDNYVVTLRFGNGTICTLDANRRAAYGFDHRVEASGRFGIVQVENQHLTSLRQFQETESMGPIPVSRYDRFAEAIEEEVFYWLETLRNGGTSRVSIHDCVRNALIIESIQKSILIGKPVSMNWNLADTDMSFNKS